MNTSASEAQSRPDDVTKTRTSTHTYTHTPGDTRTQSHTYTHHTHKQANINATKRNGSKILFSAHVVLVCYFLLPPNRMAGENWGGKLVAFPVWLKSSRRCGQCKVEMQSIWGCPMGLRRVLEPPVALMTSVERGRRVEEVEEAGTMDQNPNQPHWWPVQVRVSHSNWLRLLLSVNPSGLVRDVSATPYFQNCHSFIQYYFQPLKMVSIWLSKANH